MDSQLDPEIIAFADQQHAHVSHMLDHLVALIRDHYQDATEPCPGAWCVGKHADRDIANLDHDLLQGMLLEAARRLAVGNGPAT